MTTTPAHTASAQAMATDYVQMEDGSGHGYVSCVGDGNGKMHDGALPPGRQQQTLQPGGLVHFDSAALDRARDEAHRHAGINGTVGLEAGTTCADDDNRLGDDDEQDTLHADPSIFSSVVTADGISDPVGFHIVCLVGLIGDMGRGCMFPTLWPLVQSIGGNSMTLGHAVAAFSFGRILMSPVLGSWSHRYGYTQTLALSLVIVLLGTLLYAQVVNVHVGQPEALLMLAQLVLGLGSGTLGVTRAFVADVTPIRNRTTYMAWLAAVQYAGFTVTSAIGAAFAHFFSQEGRGLDACAFVLNGFTAPAYFMATLCIISLVLIAFFFRDRTRSRRNDSGKRKSKRQQSIDDFATKTTFVGITVYEAAILGCLLLTFTTKGSIVSFETLGIAFADSYFGMEPTVAGSIVGVCGMFGVAMLLSMGKLAKIMSDFQMIVGGMVVMVLSVTSLSGLEDGGDENNPAWRYWLAMMLMDSVGYPLGHTAIIGLFSKIIGRKPQGTLLGWFATAGSAARVVFPLMSGYVAHLASINLVFHILCGVLSLSILFTILARETLEGLIR